MKKWILIFIGTILVGGAFAQSLSLEEYRTQVLEYNQDLQKAQQSAEGALYSLKSIKTGFFPRVDVLGNYSWQFEEIDFLPGTPLKHDNYGVEAGIVQQIYTGGAVRKQHEVAKLQYAIAQLAVEHTTDNIVYAADVCYWTLVANQNLLRIAEEYVVLINELYGIVNKRFEEGAISRTDLLMVQNRLKEAELQQNTAMTNYRIALQSLNIMVGADPDREVFLSDTIRHTLQQPQEQELDKALEKRADYQVAVKNVEVAKMQTRMARSEFLPQIVVGVKEKYGTQLLNVNGDRKWATTAYAQVNIPVFHWGKMRKEVQKGRSQEEVRELERTQLRDQVNKELSKAWVNMTETANRLEIVRSSLEIAEDNLDLNTFSYNEGKLPILDVLSAQASWLQAYTNVVSVNYQYKVAIAEYMRVLGTR